MPSGNIGCRLIMLATPGWLYDDPGAVQNPAYRASENRPHGRFFICPIVPREREYPALLALRATPPWNHPQNLPILRGPAEGNLVCDGKKASAPMAHFIALCYLLFALFKKNAPVGRFYITLPWVG